MARDAIDDGSSREKGGSIMSNEQFEAAMQRAMAAMESLPVEQREKLMVVVEETRRRHERIQQSVMVANEAMDDWRILQKYMVFDREAQARERQSREKLRNSGDSN